ncbi:hypothetical protein LUZ61_019929 [Rhynchospora tenuis]|uniref:F-box domain-containing protein n=1 Tax=Rhynchospora tenuis TaxID=198213 RepID=A0AAD6ENA2_9POAL|nr:hypothetical protein LUZ61_019929 [Rhynchospora tenuis]
MAGADRISELHDSILTRILSYLPTKEAVRTRRLSKRWRNVWAFVPVLDFDFAKFWSDEISSGRISANSFGEYSKCHQNFVNFINAVLASRQLQRQLQRQFQHLDIFRLIWKYQDDLCEHHSISVTRWIDHVVQQLPRVLSIYLQFDRLEIPDYVIFLCSSLEEMNLQVRNRGFQALNPVGVYLPHLRKLNLGHFKIEADFMDKLLVGCPILEELELFACWLLISHISCRNLKSLVINGCYHSTEIEVSIPSLQYLKVTIMSSQTEGYVFTNMSSLVKASICLLAVNDLRMLIFNSEAKIIAGLFGVTTLDIVLYGKGAKYMLKHILKTCPYFENLTFMHVGSFDGCMAGRNYMIDRLIQHSPSMKELTFYCCQDNTDDKIHIGGLREVLGEYGTVRLVERHQGHTYGFLSELEELLHEYMKLFARIEAAAVEEEEEDEGGISWDNEEVDEGEASSAEGEEEEDEGEGSSAEGEEESDEWEASSTEEEDDWEDEAEHK